MNHLFRSSLGGLAVALSVSAAELKVDPSEMPRFPAYEPEDALKTFKVKKGYHLELAAHEPLVRDPITMCFDEKGRLFVVEMIDYSERREEDPHLGRVRMLEDVDGDGEYDRASVYADDLPWPTALVCHDGGVFIGASPDIYWCRDNDGDGKADERKVVFTGFAGEVSRLNVQALFNSFQWGIDNRIHGACGATSGNRIRRADDPDDNGIVMRRVDFSFDPRKLDMRIENGGGQYGMSFDSQGRKFMCSNSSHAQHSVYAYRYGGANPHFAMPPARVGIAKEGGAAEVFRLSADEPWRVIRTRWRISGVVRGMVEGGGRVSGYFTGATGVTVQKGDAYGPSFMDNLFVGDAGGNLVHRKIVESDGIDLIARRPDDEQNYEFIASTDNWFRPVHFQNGPDGCLYIADMYRETIEHPWSIPPEIKQHLDLNSGNDRGRIYRIAPDGFRHPGKVDLAAKSDAELIDLLDHAGGWQRETASRLLYTRKVGREVLAKALTETTTGLGRMHALHLAAALDHLTEEDLKAAFGHSDARVREHAIALAEPFDLGREMMEMMHDPSDRVRFQLALTMSRIKIPAEFGAIGWLLKQDAGDRWIRAAALNAVSEMAGSLFSILAEDKSRFRKRPEAGGILAELARMIGTRAEEQEVEQVLKAAAAEWLSGDMQTYVTALNTGLKTRRKTVLNYKNIGAFASRFAQLPDHIAMAKQPDAKTIRLAAIGGYSFTGKQLVGLLKSSHPNSVRQAALSALLGMSEGGAYTGIVSAWSGLDESLQKTAVAGFLRSVSRTRMLLAAMDQGKMDRGLLDTRQVQTLRSSRDTTIKSLGIKLFGAEKKTDFGMLMAQYQPALAKEGDGKRGKEIYTLRCATCHRANGEGHQLGPDMVTVKTKGRENLLLNILNPNAEVAPQFMAFEVETKDDESFTAVIGNETTTHLTIRMANGIEQTLVRTQIKGMRSSGKSLMPEELHKDLTVQQMADLLTFVEQSN